jgi:anthraniloyl-CoA monooxygenase
MRIGVVGGGPAGLYFAILAKRADPSRQVTVWERNPADVTYGWGVVFSEETLTELRDADYATFVAFDRALVRWQAIDVRYRDAVLRSHGHGFSAIARASMLGLLQDGARDLGVELRFGADLADLSPVEDCDLVVGADGLRSIVREAHAKVMRPSAVTHTSRFAWFGADLAYEVFTFIFRQTEHGLFQVHAYPIDDRRSTFIVECTDATWRAAGLDRMDEQASAGFCSRLFADHLGGRPLLVNSAGATALWRTFATIRCRSWSAGNAVLLGDAAHTAHFSIGSGTKLALEDAIALSKALTAHPADLAAAFAAYEAERQPAVERFQEAASDSARYFETVSRYLHLDPEPFTFNLLTRSGRITHADLQRRDPGTTTAMDRAFAEEAGAAAPRVVVPPPALAPLRLRDVLLANRVAVATPPLDTAEDGHPTGAHAEALLAAAATGAGLVVTDLVAVSNHARVSSGSVGCYTEAHGRWWAGAVERLRAAWPEVRLAMRLGHAGPRGATRPRDGGLDRPLRDGAWTTLAASAVPYTPRSVPPAPVDAQRFREVRQDVEEAARLAAAAGVDVLLVDCSDGYLLASFLSPLTNRRDDGYGGDLQARLRWPLEIVAAARAVWPGGRPLGVRLVADDRVPGGLTPEDGVAMARAFAAAGADLIDVTAGHTLGTERSAPDYRRLYGVALADRIRNEAAVAVVASGGITTVDEVSTVVAAARADVCRLDPHRYEGARL